MTGDMERCRLGEMPRQARLDDRRGPVVRGRKVFCQVAVRKLGYTGASVARFLGMTTSSVNRMARLKEMRDKMGGGILGAEEFREKIKRKVADARRRKRGEQENSLYLFVN